MFKATLTLLLCVCLGVLFISYHDPKNLDAFRSSFLTMSLTIATFYVSFAIGSLNSSAYRTFYRAFPNNFLVACILFLLLAFVPLGVLVIMPIYFVKTSLIALPLLVGTGVCLLEIARYETDALTLLERMCSKRTIKNYLESLIPQIDAKIEETKALELSSPRDRPQHELAWYLPVPIKKDEPLSFLSTLGLLTIQRGDLPVLARVVARALEVCDLSDHLEVSSANRNDYAIKSYLKGRAFEVLERMVAALQREKGNVNLDRIVLDRLTDVVIAKTKAHKQTQDSTLALLCIMQTLGEHAYECGSQHEIRIPIIVSRQIVQKGLDNPPTVLKGQQVSERIEHFSFYLPHLTSPIMSIGNYAIKKRDSALLYLCFEAFGFLGCSSVKHEQIETTTTCLRALSQLGREAKAANLECHWDQCAVKPEDHAAERIDRIASWLFKIPTERRNHWTDLVNAAYSRLSGRKTTITITDNNGRPSVRKITSQVEHIESYNLHAGCRSVNYSDFSFLKDLELHGGTGIIWQGPLMPMYEDESACETKEPPP